MKRASKSGVNPENPLFNATDLSKASAEANRLHNTHSICICCASAILKAFRGNYTAKCDEMPWRCPLATANKTPVA
jgi:hypothetical protein